MKALKSNGSVHPRLSHNNLMDQSCCTKFKRVLSKCCCCAPCFFNSPPNPQASILQSQQHMSSMQPISLQHSVMSGSLALNRNKLLLSKQYQWKVVEGSYIYQDKTCSICLADAANIKIECNHLFHKSCLWTWFKNKNSCPNCRKNTTFVHVFCQVCFFQYYTNTLQGELKSQSVDQFGLPIMKVCPGCEKEMKGKEKGKASI